MSNSSNPYSRTEPGHNMIQTTYHNEANPEFFKPYKYDPNYSLDSFLYNQKNQLAFITCYKLLYHELQDFNLFLIFGEYGIGKTHLMKSILNEFAKKNLTNNILYTNPQNIYYYLKDNDNLQEIENLTQSYTIVGIDDFQLIHNYPNTIYFIFKWLNICLERSIKIFICCNKKEDIYHNIEEKFRLELDNAIHIQLSNPDMDVKMRYIDQFCTQNNIPLDDEQIMHLARQFNDFKTIQTVLNRLLSTQTVWTTPPPGYADDHLHQEIQAVATPPLTTQSIISELSDYFQIPSQDILSSTKRREAVRARQFGMTICRQMLNLSYPRIGEAFGGRDHSTVMHSINKLLKLLEKDKNLHHMFQSVKQRCEQLRF